jgi:hypothetical protein
VTFAVIGGIINSDMNLFIIDVYLRAVRCGSARERERERGEPSSLSITRAIEQESSRRLSVFDNYQTPKRHSRLLGSLTHDAFMSLQTIAAPPPSSSPVSIVARQDPLARSPGA